MQQKPLDLVGPIMNPSRSLIDTFSAQGYIETAFSLLLSTHNNGMFDKYCTTIAINIENVNC